MERETERLEAPIDLGAVSVETKGPTGAPIDEVQGFLQSGLTAD